MPTETAPKIAIVCRRCGRQARVSGARERRIRRALKLPDEQVLDETVLHREHARLSCSTCGNLHPEVVTLASEGKPAGQGRPVTRRPRPRTRPQPATELPPTSASPTDKIPEAERRPPLPEREEGYPDDTFFTREDAKKLRGREFSDTRRRHRE